MSQTLSLDLDEATLALARDAALARGQTLEGLVEDVVRQLGRTSASVEDGETAPAGAGDTFLGMFSDDPDLIDQVVSSTMAARERDPLRLVS